MSNSTMPELKRRCRNCFEIKDIKEFSINNRRLSIYRRDCKVCRGEMEARRLLEKQQAKAPYRFVDCEGCDHIINKCHAVCPKCGWEWEKKL